MNANTTSQEIEILAKALKSLEDNGLFAADLYAYAIALDLKTITLEPEDDVADLVQAELETALEDTAWVEDIFNEVLEYAKEMPES